jgi:hypothetical protein
MTVYSDKIGEVFKQKIKNLYLDNKALLTNKFALFQLMIILQ